MSNNYKCEVLSWCPQLVTILSHLLSKPTGSNSKLTLQAVKWSKDETAQVAQVRKMRNPFSW